MDNDRRINLIFLPFAGASFYAYRNFEKYLPGFIRPVTVDLPGRGNRMKEPALTDIHDMARDIFHQVSDSLQTPYALYGHSMGASLAYLLALLLAKKENIPQPLHLFSSGSTGPDRSVDRALHTLPRDEFIAAVLGFGGMPEEVLKYDELLDFFIPILRTDFQATHALPDNPTEIIDIPLTALFGNEDKLTKGKEIKWEKLTRREFKQRQFPGNHFFIFDHLQEICKIITDTLEK